MAKSNIKNFVCSFVLSLLAVTAINKAAFRDLPTVEKDKTNDADIKAQNISLFSKTEDPIDILPALITSEVDTSAIDALTASVPESDAVVAAEPLEEASAADTLVQVPTTPENTSFKVSALKPEINTDISAASEIVLEKENVITVAETSPESYESKGIVYADVSDTVVDEKVAADELEKTVVYTPEDDKAVSLNLVLKTSEEDITVAKQDIPAPTILEETPIPLEESEGYLHEKIDTMHAADASQIAMLEPEQLMSSLEETQTFEEKTLAEIDLKQNEWTQMSETVQEDSPWVVAKGNRFAKNRAVVEQFSEIEEDAPADEETEVEDDAAPAEENRSEDVSIVESEETLNETATMVAQPQVQEIKDTLTLTPIADEDAETQVAYQMVPNLLIPIPEDIANDADLTPQLSIVPGEKPVSQPAPKTQDKNNKNKSTELNEEEKQSGLFKNITSWFSGKDKKEEKKSEKKQKNPTRQTLKKSGFSFFNDTEDDTSSETNDKIMPAELRLSFQPNRAEISGQTLRWIHAFADNARDNNDIYIEIRIDGTSSFALQQKRLNLLSTIFAGRGVDFRKINVVFTSREPNSFIIRNIRFNNQEEIVVNENSNNAYYRPW